MLQVIEKNHVSAGFVQTTNGKNTKQVRHAMDRFITLAAMRCGLCFSESRPLAVISGAGIAGLSAGITLLQRGFKVAMFESRDFSRENVINLNREVIPFLKKSHMLQQFESSVAARITDHNIVVIGKNGTRYLPVSDVSQLQEDPSLSFEPENFNNLLNEDGIYSVQIGALQTFLADHLLKNGGRIFRCTKEGMTMRTTGSKVSRVQTTVYDSVKPDLFFIAEGKHSKTSRKLGMTPRKINDLCSHESWVFGNIPYTGSKSFVFSLIDVSEGILRIANVIFNAKSKVVNVAVTYDPSKGVSDQILHVAHQVFNLPRVDQVFNAMEYQATHLELKHVSGPVYTDSQALDSFSNGNAYSVGDTAGVGSALAGLGGTFGMAFVTELINRLVNRYLRGNESLHEDFGLFSEGYTRRWRKKSCDVKQFCLNCLEDQSKESAL